MKKTKATLLLLATIHTSSFAINKCTDTNGKVTFTDTACPQNLIWDNPPPPVSPTQSEELNSEFNGTTHDTSPENYTPAREPYDSSEKEAAQRLLLVLKSHLKDPDSAQFRDIKISTKIQENSDIEKEYTICGQFNAKNSYGGYNGFHGFVVTKNSEGIQTAYVQSDDLGGIVWMLKAKQIGCL